LAIQGIEAFSGAGRRLQVLREGPIAVVDDYAHHPTEIAASIQALRERFPNRRMVVVYQPHLYSRTAGLIPEFAESLSAADLLVITDIYPAREAPMPGVSSARIAEAARCPVRYVPQRHMLPRFVADLALPGDLIVGMGAGNIAEFAPNFLAEIDRTGPTRVCIAFGGDSAEREISLHSGQQVLAALLGKGYEARLLDVSELLLTGGSVADLIGPQRPDVAFLAVHGTHAEDGAIQGFFELLHIPYTGSGMQASALAMNKHLTKRVLAAHGLPVPLGWLIGPDETWDEVEGDRFVVKPNEQGSTVGLSFVDDPAQLGHAIANALQYGDQALVEECVQGTEISVPVLGDWVLPPVEIVPASGTYDFAAKYLPGATEEICPARLPEDILARAQDHALRAHRALGCRGATRTDMIVREDSTCVILEVNTLPGMTATSLLPNSARVAGVPFAELCAWIVEDALSRKASS
jgi:D-alanine--D-alanine ligase